VQHFFVIKVIQKSQKSAKISESDSGHFTNPAWHEEDYRKKWWPLYDSYSVAVMRMKEMF